jgi:hypothetical protein
MPYSIHKGGTAALKASRSYIMSSSTSLLVSVPQITQAQVDALRPVTTFQDPEFILPVVNSVHTAEDVAWKYAQKSCRKNEKVANLKTFNYDGKAWNFTFIVTSD